MALSSKPNSRQSPKLQHLRKPGADITVINREHVRELHITLRSMPNERTAMMLWRLEAILREHEGTIVRAELFGSGPALAETAARLRKLLREPELPITAVDTGTPGGLIDGMHVLAVADAEVEPLIVGGREVGRVFHDGHARHLLLSEVLPEKTKGSRADQARSVFDRLEEYAQAAGMELPQLARTWLFLDEIHDWYGLFNAVRTEFYKTRKMAGVRVPASTGAGGKNTHGAALVAGAWLVAPAADSLLIRELVSPLQCPATEYGSLFSRALELLTPEYRRLLISGTASIHRDGGTARVGNVRGQIEFTMDVVQALLAANDLTFAAATRGTAYFKNIADAHFLDEWCRRQELLRLPVISVQAESCRDDLLFELELDVMSQVMGPVATPKVPRQAKAKS